jgi:hypothetical protein
MALHRDIFWVGRQWAVTGFGIQAVDQRLNGAFDIEATLLWEDGLVQQTRALAWLNHGDFDRALEIARSRFPLEPRKELTLVESVLELIQSNPADGAKPAERAEGFRPIQIGAFTPQARPQAFAMQIEHASAKFVPFWRIRH